MVVVGYSRRSTNNGQIMDSLLVMDLMSVGDITHSYRKGTYLMGTNGRRKRRKSFKCGFVVISTVNILISKSAEISGSAKK